MKARLLPVFVFIFCLISISAQMPTCSDTNEIDISDIPCLGFTVSLDCSDNITALDTSNASINFSIPITGVLGGVFNFTFNLSEGGYELIDCSNNTATVIVGKFEQGYGVNIFLIILPTILLSFLSLFVAGRLFGKYRNEDEEEEEEKIDQRDEDSFVPRSRLIPIVFMLFAFVPMIFMIGFVENHLTEYLPGSNATIFYGMFYILFSTIFYATFLLSFVIWISFWIQKRSVLRGIH